MLYQIEKVKSRKNKKLVIVYIVILLLVLGTSIGMGILVAKSINKNNTEKDEYNISEKKVEQHIERTTIKGLTNVNDTTKKKFFDEVEDIYNGEEGKRVFLTFDDGPSNAVTPYILDTLKKYNVKATFFVLGNRVESNSELIKREYNEGHYIANHGYSHKYSKIYSSSSKVLEEYNKTEDAIKKVLGEEYSSNLFRFPGGSIGGEYDAVKKQTRKLLKEKNIAYLDWNSLTNDSAGANTKEKIMKNLKDTVANKNNVVVLMHDAPDKILTYETLPEIINYLQKRGYAFKNMYDLIKTEE